MLDRKGWTLAQFHTLPRDEQHMWLAYEMNRISTLDGMKDAMQEKRDSKGAFVNWTPEVAAQIMLERYT